MNNETPGQVVEEQQPQVEAPKEEKQPSAPIEQPAELAGADVGGDETEKQPESSEPEPEPEPTDVAGEPEPETAEEEVTEEQEMPKRKKKAPSRKPATKKTVKKRKAAKTGKPAVKVPSRKPARKKNPSRRTKTSRAVKALGWRLKTDYPAGECAVVRCAASTGNSRTLWCPKHQEEVRRVQLRLNNGTWRKRVASGAAKHNVLYRGKPTAWAKANPDKALRTIKGHATITERELRSALRGTRKAA